MQNFKGAIFDMDGTLLDSMPVWKRLTQRYLAQFDVHITDADYAVCEGFSQPQVAEYFLKRYPNLPLTQQQMLDGMDEMITSPLRDDCPAEGRRDRLSRRSRAHAASKWLSLH